MRMTLREDHCVAGLEVHGRLRLHLHEALTLGDEMEDHDPFCAGFEQRRCRIRVRRLVTPRCAESAFDEYGTDETHHP
jgi:hypothetical protein